jgi:hypothetical protein
MNDNLKIATLKKFRTVTAKYNKLESFWERTQFGVFSKQPESYRFRLSRFYIRVVILTYGFASESN